MALYAAQRGHLADHSHERKLSKRLDLSGRSAGGHEPEISCGEAQFCDQLDVELFRQRHESALDDCGVVVGQQMQSDFIGAHALAMGRQVADDTIRRLKRSDALHVRQVEGLGGTLDQRGRPIVQVDERVALACDEDLCG